MTNLGLASVIFLQIVSSSFADPIRPLESVNGVVTVPLSFLQLGYVTEIGIGTPVQKFLVEVSTTRQGVWVSSTDCGDYCDKENNYNSSASSTHQVDGREVGSEFEGSLGAKVHGVMSKDVITLRNGEIVNQVRDAPFAEMINVPEHYFHQTNVSGNLGLGFQVDQPFTSFIDDLSRSGLIRKPVAGFQFKKVKILEKDQFVEDAGKVTIGNEIGDGSLIAENPIWVRGQNISDMRGGSDLYVRVMGFDVNKKPLHCAGPDGCLASISSSSPMIKLPEGDAFRLNNILGFLPWMGVTFMTDCRRMDYLPDIDITIGSIKISIPPSDYLIKTKPPSPIFYKSVRGVEYQDDEDDKVCMSRFVGHDDPDKIILGQPFLQNIYTLFDYENRKFGFARYRS